MADVMRHHDVLTTKWGFLEHLVQHPCTISPMYGLQVSDMLSSHTIPWSAAWITTAWSPFQLSQYRHPFISMGSAEAKLCINEKWWSQIWKDTSFFFFKLGETHSFCISLRTDCSYFCSISTEGKEHNRKIAQVFFIAHERQVGNLHRGT